MGTFVTEGSLGKGGNHDLCVTCELHFGNQWLEESLGGGAAGNNLGGFLFGTGASSACVVYGVWEDELWLS